MTHHDSSFLQGTTVDLPVLAKPDVIILSHQRSGTHFLQSSLGSHPRIYPRGEFILQYKRQLKRGIAHPEAAIGEDSYRFHNRPDFFNIGIVMYSQVDLFEELCSPIGGCRIIHLLRDPIQIARSVTQMEADRKLLGVNFRAHYKTDEELPAPAPVPPDAIEYLAAKVARVQNVFKTRLNGRSDILTISYEELTGDRQVNKIPEPLSRMILDFMGVEFFPLINDLRKTSLRS